jgi:very-short-patch-repair endonuclease
METPEHRQEREERSLRPAPITVRNVVPAGREEGSSGRPERIERNEVPGDESPERAIAGIATSQRGSITHAQLLRSGLDHSGIGRRSESGSLHRVHRGIYLVGHEALAPLARETAALLACGREAVLSHISAAIVWSLAPPSADGDEVHVTVRSGKRRSRAGLRVHRSSTLHPRDLRRINGLPVTAPARTLLDLAAAGYPDLERAFAEAHAQRILKASDIDAVVARAGARPGVRAIRALIADNASGFTRSKAERLLRKLVRSARLPEPSFNVPFGKWELDALWAEQRLVVEVDGYSYHGHRQAFESNRRKDMALVAAGYTVIRVSWGQLHDEPLAVVAAIATALGGSRQPG